MGAGKDDSDDRIVDYVIEHEEDLSFTEYFWKGCEPLESDLVQYGRFVASVRSAYDGVDNLTIAREVGVSVPTVVNWVSLSALPKLVHFLRAHLRLGTPPEGQVWLTLETSHGRGNPVGAFVRVPLCIESWSSIRDVLEQLQPLPGHELVARKEYQFGFLLGMIIGDANKPHQGRGHRHIDLTLSMKYDTNLKIGDFTCECAMSLGLRMHRVKDRPRKSNKPHGFYEWTSQSSPLIDWIFNVALGLKDGDRTTYDSVHADWVLDAPVEFRVGLVNGLAESDGSVSVASQAVEFWVDPHRELLKGLLATFGLHGFNSRQAFTLSKSQAIKSFEVPVFSAILKTVRYQKLELLASCKKIEKTERLPQEIRQEIMDMRRKGMSVPSIVEAIARTRKILVSFEAAQRWARKGNRGAALDARENGNDHEKN